MVSVFLANASDTFLCLQNDYGQTALHLAVREDHLAMVSVYTSRGVCLNDANKDGDTPLHYSAHWGRPRAAKLLIEAGAKQMVRNHKGEMPLDDAQAREDSEMIRILTPGVLLRTDDK